MRKTFSKLLTVTMAVVLTLGMTVSAMAATARDVFVDQYNTGDIINDGDLLYTTSPGSTYFDEGTMGNKAFYIMRNIHTAENPYKVSGKWKVIGMGQVPEYGDRIIERYDEPAEVSPCSHVHEFVTGEIYPATTISDGLEGTYCKTCGYIRESSPISAYTYSLNDYAGPMIKNAKAGQTVTFEFGEFNTFPVSFMEKIAAKSAEGVTFVFHYKWNHVSQEITIPAGATVDVNPEVVWYGPAKLQELYGE